MGCKALLRVALVGAAVSVAGWAFAQEPQPAKEAPQPAKETAAVAERPLDPDLVSDLAAAYRALAALNVLDGFGHVSIRDPRNPNHYLIARALAPELVNAGDIIVLDLDSKPVYAEDREAPLYHERFIHGEIYKARPDVNAIVHSHSPTVVPFSVTSAKLRPILLNAGFLAGGPRVFEIRSHAGDSSNLEIETPQLGAALARTLGRDAVVLMRGHGDTVVADSLPNVVFRAYYTEVNARQLAQSLALGGSVNYLTPGEAKTTDAAMQKASARPWALWRAKAR